MDSESTPRLFVSHHSSKLDIALLVEKALARHGVACWIAPRDVDPGEAFDSAITKAIDESAAVLLLFCSRSDKSRHVKRELILADSARKAIIPLRLEEIAPHDLAYHLASAQWIDGVERRDDALARIAAKTHRLANGSADAARVADDLHEQFVATAASAPPPTAAVAVAAAPASVSVRTLGLIVLAIAAAALVAWFALRGGDGERPTDPVAATTGGQLDSREDVAITAEVEGAAIPGVRAPPPAPAATAGTHIPPSFDCTKASARAEILICGDEELAMLDREMSRAYRDLRAVAGADRQQLDIDQRGWRLAERDVCPDADCLAHAMRARILELNQDRLSVLDGGDL